MHFDSTYDFLMHNTRNKILINIKIFRVIIVIKKELNLRTESILYGGLFPENILLGNHWMVL